jgi:HSP20 family molecular chaperone IbpA
MPSADIEETDDAYVLEIDLPGVRREDLDIELRDNEVRITAEIKQKERKGILRRQTRRFGQFDFVYESCAMLRTEIDSMPAELDELTRRVTRLEIEDAALSKEDDRADR